LSRDHDPLHNPKQFHIFALTSRQNLYPSLTAAYQGGRMNRWLFGALAAGLGATVTTAFAADPAIPPAENNLAVGQEQVAEANFQRQLDQYQYDTRTHVNDQIPPDERLLADYGAYLSFNFLSVMDPNGNTHVLRESDAVGYAQLNLDNVQQLFVRGRVSYRDYDPGDSFGGGIQGTGQHSSIEELYYRFDLQKYLSAYKGVGINDDAAVELGRQTVIWGNGLVFNQDLDGGVMDLIKGPFSLEGVAGVSVPDTIDFDTSRPGFNDRTTRGYFGLLLSMQAGHNHPYAYFLSERDFNSARPLIVTTASSTITTDFDYNSDYVGLGSTGSVTDHLAYGVEGALELGNTLSNSYLRTSSGITPVPQKVAQINSFAADYRLDYAYADPHDSRTSAELIMASGDHDREITNNTFGGVKPGTRDLAFNGFGLLNTGLAFSPDVSNVLILRVGASTDPFNSSPLFRKLEVGVDGFVFDKYLEQAPIDEPTANGRFLGWEPDFFMNWQITSDVTLAMRYGIFEPGDKILSSNKNRQLFFTGVTVAF
jgi:hypothetical protein